MRRMATCSSSTTPALGFCGTPSADRIWAYRRRSPGLPASCRARTRVRSTPAWLSNSGGCSSAKAVHDHGLAHAAVAVDGDAWHPGGARMLQQQVENSQHLAGAGILHPAFAEDGTNALIMGRLQQLGGRRGQVGQIIAHAFPPIPSSAFDGLRELIPFRLPPLLSGAACGGRSSRLLRVATVCRRAASTISRCRSAVLNRRASSTSRRPWARRAA